jgi:Zn-dependent protease with chaperone function
MQDLSKVLSSGWGDGRVQSVITKCLGDGLLKHFVVGIVFREKSEDPPAFSLGFQILNYPIGVVCVGENLQKSLTSDESEFVVLHEIGHAVKNHWASSSLVWLGKSGIVRFLGDAFHLSKKDAEDLLGAFKLVYMMISGKVTIEEDMKAQMELEADKYAVTLQGRKEPAITCLSKLMQSNLKTPTHITVDGKFVFPVVTAEQRIEAINRLPL